MHIVHFCGALKGGPLSAIAEWTRYQIAANHKVSLIYSPLRDPIKEFRDDLPSQVEFIPLSVRRNIHPISDFRACRALTALLREMRPDVIHLHSSKAGAIGRIAAWLAGIPAVYSPHGVSYLRTDVGVTIRAIFFALEWLLGPLGAMTVACSPSELQRIRFIPGRKMIIPNGIDLTSLPLLDVAPPHDRLELVLCGRITAQKNPGLACQIASLSPPLWRWTWLGDGELRDVVTRASRITVAGWQPRATALARLCASDIMVHTSSWEGMPIAILEGMALGLPVVATNVIGNRDLIVNGKTGYVVDSASDFLAALKTLSESKELRHRMGAAGRARVAAEFDQAQLAKRWMVLYEKMRCLTSRP